jgi:protein gp37
MSTATKIEWTRGDDGTAGATWNPVTGCSEVSEGCDHCYAKTFAERWRGVPGHPFEQGFDIRLWPDRLGLPLRWRKPKRVFLNSMSDLSGRVANFQDRITGAFPHFRKPIHRPASCATGVGHERAMSRSGPGDVR